MVKEKFPNCYPVSQLANIGGDKTSKTVFRWIILINPLFFCNSPDITAYPQDPRTYPQKWNYFPTVKAAIHIKSLKINGMFYLASSGNHQYGLPEVFLRNRWEKYAGNTGGTGVLGIGSSSF